MIDATSQGSGAIVHARTAQQHFELTRAAPAVALEPFVDHYWIVQWDLRGREPHRQRVITHPSVHMTFTSYLTTGEGRARVTGVQHGEFVEEIAGQGRVIGAQFRVGGFRPFLSAPMSTITDRFVPVDEIFGDRGRAAAAGIVAAPDAAAGVALIDDFLTGSCPKPDPAIVRLAEIVRRIRADPTLTRVDRLAEDLAMTPRRLQQLFDEYVGVGPKWVIRRLQMHGAAERAADGADIDWAELAAHLGYADQAHFTRAFTATVGVSPARYARTTAT
ncbi:helix-turn-helix domain-containing protein [Fodinicola feengrottensis]|uniref:Helix-turn-helix domain-containing protein n=1 Tax=Fodinicola feengrottensis TaxID=435914 RepID=A0ABN2IYR0_9ACTN